ncbi:MAG TPA: phosphoadenosine phosphosulfate reductase family protein [Candidatus Cryosericum sp.]|nr:phosphoadenosine phosphosulfate reductase family protein [Candidatus Cryosericum sp.]
MRLYEANIFGLDILTEKSIRLLKKHEPPDGYYVAFSGGKDSTVMLDLVKRAGVKYDAHYNFTTVDPPELVTFIRSQYPEVHWERPKETMYALIERMMTPPTRLMRYCCRILKEHGGEGRTCVTGIRAEESQQRASRAEVDIARLTGKENVNPIFMWSSNDIWQYINERRLPYCSLYDEGFDRLGCIGCPMAGPKERERQFQRWPGIEKAYIAACQHAVDRRIEKGKQTETSWANGQEMFDWWMERTEKQDIEEAA